MWNGILDGLNEVLQILYAVVGKSLLLHPGKNKKIMFYQWYGAGLERLRALNELVPLGKSWLREKPLEPDWFSKPVWH